MESENQTNSIFTERTRTVLWVILIFAFVVLVGFGIYFVANNAKNDSIDQNNKDIQNCKDMGGTVYLGSGNWFDKCVISP